MIQIEGTNVFRHSRRIGYVMGDSVFLTKEISKADQRKVREILKKQQNIDVQRFIPAGNFVRH